MRLTTKSRYGTRLILDLAINAQNGPVPLSDISKRQNISLKYLEHLTRTLRDAGLIQSQRGAFGGHMLKKAPADITIGDIVRTLEKTTAITDCAETEEACADGAAPPCPHPGHNSVLRPDRLVG